MDFEAHFGRFFLEKTNFFYDVKVRRQPLKNLVKHRQERQNSRFELLREVRERCKKSKKNALKPMFFFTSIFKGFLSQLGWI